MTDSNTTFVMLTQEDKETNSYITSVEGTLPIKCINIDLKCNEDLYELIFYNLLDKVSEEQKEYYETLHKINKSYRQTVLQIEVGEK